MSPKQDKKSIWVDCDKCGCIITSHDQNSHVEQNCKRDQVKRPFIEEGKLYSRLDPGIISEGAPRDSVLIHHATAKQIGAVKGGLLQLTRDGSPTLVRRMEEWPSKESSYHHPGAVLMPTTELARDWRNYRNVAVSLLTEDTPVAAQITINVKNHKVESEFCGLIKDSFCDYVVNVGTVLFFYWFSKKLEIVITDVKALNCNDCNRNWFILNNETVWNIRTNVQRVGKESKVLGGVNDIVQKIRTYIKFSFDTNLNFQPIRGLLLYGPSGVGKTAICKYIIETFNCFSVEINGPAVFSKYFGETENTMKDLFNKAIQNEPSIIVVDEIETICPRTTSGSTEQEKRVMSAFAFLLNSLNEDRNRVIVLATTREPEAINLTLRRYGRLGEEIEIPVPDKIRRKEILYSLLKNVPNKVSSQDIDGISDLAHGYVAADLVNLCTQAATKCAKRLGDVVEKQDLMAAMTVVRPSAMRELLIEVPNVRWSDIGGQANVKLKLRQAVEWPLKNGESFRRLGIKPPAGVLLYGPPGCSKTMIAKALATESGLNFLSINGPEIFSKWVGESERAVRVLFTKARQVAPSVIFFDEMDAIGGERGAGEGGVQERIVAQLLTELDGISPLHSVTILAATNRPDKMDRALLRPGRLDRLIYVPLPDIETRLQILELQLEKMATSDDVNPHNLSIRTEGFSGAELVSLCQEAALFALEKDLDCPAVTMEHFEHILINFKPRTPNYLLKLYEEFAQNNSN